jgi:hypothetical protein
VVSLLAELHGHERQAAEELERWKTHHEERKVVDASPAAVTLALLLTDEELDSLEKRAGDGEIAGRGRKGGSTEASPQPAARHGEPAQVSPANVAAPDGRPRIDGVRRGIVGKAPSFIFANQTIPLRIGILWNASMPDKPPRRHVISNPGPHIQVRTTP